MANPATPRKFAAPSSRDISVDVTVQLNAAGAVATRSFDVTAIDHLARAAWAGRDSAAVEAHIRELEALGVPRPSRTPLFYRVASSLLTTSDSIQVLGDDTSGEVEFVIVRSGDGLWVGLGSD